MVRAIESAGGRTLAIRAGNAEVEAVKNAVAETVKVFDCLDILVNNAGVVALVPIDEFKLEDFDRLVAVNVRGIFVAIQEAVRHMGEGGRIINIGSVNSDLVPFAGGSVYALTKGAIASFTRGLARDLGPRGITVNNVQPGPVDTDMNPADGPFAAQVKGLIVLQRYAQSDEIAGMVSYLASPEAACVTGASLKIDADSQPDPALISLPTSGVARQAVSYAGTTNLRGHASEDLLANPREVVRMQNREGAFRDVLNALVAYQKTRQRREELVQQTKAAADAVRRARLRYNGGNTSNLGVLTNDANLYAAQLALAPAQHQQALSLVQLY